MTIRYFRPASLTWWSGVAAILTGGGALILPQSGPLGDAAQIVALLSGSGDASPAGLICLGLGLIGLRDRIERGFQGEA